jgi:hypothetical protein
MLLLHVYVYVGVCGLPRERSSPANERLSRHHSLDIGSLARRGRGVAKCRVWPLHPK